jgi:hypothetical protein
LVALAVGAAWAGCSAGNDDDDGAGGAPPGTGGAPTTGGMGGEGGDELPCGIDCSTIETDTCHQAVCDAPSGNCAIVPIEGEVECDDGLFCTVGDRCVEGTCTPTGQNDCQLAPAACQEVVCDEASETCSTNTLPNGVECESTDLCVVGATCTNGLCIGPTNDCFFAPTPDLCHVAVCNPSTGECDPVPGNDGFNCIDYADLCLQGGVCSGGVCGGGTPKDCSAYADDCNEGLCDMGTGVCAASPFNEGGACDDRKGCTLTSACTSGVCDGAAIASCTHDDDCCAMGCTVANDNDCQTILLFGDDITALQWDIYREALTAAGRNWDEHNYATLVTVPTAAQLANYDTLILFDENLTDYTDASHQVFADWLALGGKSFFAVGRDLLQDWAPAAIGTGERNLYALMGMTYVGSSAGTTIQRIDGVSGDPITDPFFGMANGLVLVSPLSSGDYADELFGPATHVGLYAGGSGVGLNKSAMTAYDSGTYKVVWLGVSFHGAFTDRDQRNLLMRNVLNWLKP